MAEALKAATEKAEAAKKALDGDANNETLKKAKADADAAAAKAAEEAKKAADSKAAGDKKVADLNAALTAAQAARDKASHEAVREARAGTIVFPGNPAAQLPAQSRLARAITLAVLKETAPYQLTTDVARFSVNQGSQILIPFKLLKRAGFDNNVALTFVAPPANLQVENKPINKGVAEQVYRLFVQNNVSVVFSGHDHFYERIKPQRGIMYFIVGSGGKLRAGDIDDTSLLTAKGFDTGNAFLAVEIADDTMYFNAISTDGSVVDSGVIERRILVSEP
jgi:hypothetical protein